MLYLKCDTPVEQVFRGNAVLATARGGFRLYQHIADAIDAPTQSAYLHLERQREASPPLRR